jgi:hypothetical protein
MSFYFRRNRFYALPILLACALTGSTPITAQAAPANASFPMQKINLVENGNARSAIVLAADAAEDEKIAARELQEYLRKISGANISISQSANESQLPIFIGGTGVSQEVADEIKAKGNDPASFVLTVNQGGIYVVGSTPEATRFGVYELLEQIGVRWFMPGELGTVVPQIKTISIRTQQTIQVPSFNGRWMNAGRNFPEWGKHLRMGGPYFPGAHGIPGFNRKKENDELFKTHPEYFALVNGERTMRQVNVSHPEVIKIAIEETKNFFRKNPDAQWIGMGPNDGSGFSEDAASRALDGGDFDPFSNEPSVTDRYIWFFNQILDGIKDEFPDKKIGFYSYHTYMRVPVKTKPNPRIVPAFAPIGLCRIHGMNNPICPERSYYKTLMKQWGEILPEVYERGYWFNLADPGFPFSHVHRMRDEIPTAHALGIKGWRVETIDHWGSETPSLYIAGKLMWNHEANVDALLNDFYEKFFGAAKKPMAGYFTRMDAALRDGDYHTGSSFDLPNFYTKSIRDKARSDLNAAAKLVNPQSLEGQRIQIFRNTFDYLETFISMLDNQKREDFVAAKKDLDALDAQQKVLTAYEPPLISPRGGPNYLRRFFRQPVEQGYARVQSANEKIAPLGDDWKFQIDPLKVGEDVGWWKPNITGGNWQNVKASLSWSDQGLRYYKGEAWYRQSVEIPKSFAGQKVFLWFGGVDEKAKVWVNGKEVGISHGASFLPFEFDVTNAVKPGARNVVAVRVVNNVVDELGTGGLTAPAMFYVAAPDAKPENVRELSPTFP